MEAPAPRTGHEARRPAHRTARATTAVAIALTMVFTACSGSSGSGASGTDVLPTATLTDLRTAEVADWGQDGLPMVVNLWASWCAPCRKEMPAFDRVAADLEGEVVIVGITDDLDRDAAVEAAEASGVSYPLRYDEKATVMTSLDISGLPASVFVDPDGNVVGRHLGAMTEAELRAEIEEHHGIAG